MLILYEFFLSGVFSVAKPPLVTKYVFKQYIYIIYINIFLYFKGALSGLSM